MAKLAITKRISLNVGVTLATLTLVISACSQTASDLTSDLSTFAEVGRVYDAGEFEQALAEAAIGITPSQAVVPLVFTGDGSLLSVEQARLVFEGVHEAATEVEATAFLEDAGISLYFTTAEVYALAIARLKAQGRVFDKELHSIGGENVTSLILPSLASSGDALHEFVVFVFNPYTTISPSITSVELQPTQNPDCLIRCSQRCSILRLYWLVIPCFLTCAAFC